MNDQVQQRILRSSSEVQNPISELGISDLSTTLLIAPFFKRNEQQTMKLLKNYHDISWKCDWNAFSKSMDDFVGLCTRIAFSTIDIRDDWINKMDCNEQLVILPIMMQYTKHKDGASGVRGPHIDPDLNTTIENEKENDVENEIKPYNCLP